MDAVSYPSPKVIEFFNKHLAPVRVPITSKPLPKEFNATWTPTFVILDTQGQEHHRIVGFLPPDELVPALTLGIAKSYFNRDQFATALAHLDRLIDEYPNSDSTPEAVYYRGITRYKSTHDDKELRRVNDELQARFKDSEWARRASVYQRL